MCQELFLTAVNIDITQRKAAAPLGISLHALWDPALIKEITFCDVIQILFTEK